MKIYSSYICHPGLKRTYNQDNVYYQGHILDKIHWKAKSVFKSKWDSKEMLCFGVFDGMGGEQYGETASYIAAQNVKNILSAHKAGRIPSDIMYEVCKKSNDDIWQKTVDLGVQRIGTTAAFVIIQYATIWCCNVGDSKIFRLREGDLLQLSMDHVASDSAHKDKKPGLTAHLGMNPMEMFPNPYIVNDTIQSGDVFLICSDGVTDMVRLADIEETVQYTGMTRCAGKLLKKAIAGGGTDNTTLILIKAE